MGLNLAFLFLCLAFICFAFFVTGENDISSVLVLLDGIMFSVFAIYFVVSYLWG